MNGVSWVRSSDAGVIIDIYVAPRASRTRAVGEHDGRLKLQVAAPPVDGEANDAITRFVASAVGVSRSAVRIASGSTGKRKSVAIDGVDASTVIEALS